MIIPRSEREPARLVDAARRVDRCGGRGVAVFETAVVCYLFLGGRRGRMCRSFAVAGFLVPRDYLESERIGSSGAVRRAVVVPEDYRTAFFSGLYGGCCACARHRVPACGFRSRGSVASSAPAEADLLVGRSVCPCGLRDRLLHRGSVMGAGSFALLDFGRFASSDARS